MGGLARSRGGGGREREGERGVRGKKQEKRIWKRDRTRVNTQCAKGKR